MKIEKLEIYQDRSIWTGETIQMPTLVEVAEKINEIIDRLNEAERRDEA